MTTALDRAKQALAHHDKFNTIGDDHGLYMCPQDTLYELPHNEGQFTLADLRELVQYAERSPRVGDGSGDAAIAIGEHAFRSGFGAGMAYTQDDGLNCSLAWDAYDPPEHIKELS